MKLANTLTASPPQYALPDEGGAKRLRERKVLDGASIRAYCQQRRSEGVGSSACHCPVTAGTSSVEALTTPVLPSTLG